MAKNNKSLKEQLEDAQILYEKPPYEIPKNWVWVKLKDLSEIISKGTTPKGGQNAYQKNGIGFLRIENIDKNGAINVDNLKYIQEKTHLNELRRSILKNNDILISIAGTLGRTAIIKEDSLPLNINQAIAFIRLNFNNDIFVRYIEKVLKSPFFQEVLLSQVKVTAIPNLTLEILNECKIPLAPSVEQERIVLRVENLFDKLDKAKEIIENAIDSFAERKSAILHKAFTGELTKQWRVKNFVRISDWELKKIEEIGEVKGGKRLPKGHFLTNERTGLLYIKAGNLKHGTVDLENLEYLRKETYELIKKYTVKSGDVYITIVGACIGDVGIVPENVDGANLTENAAKITNLKCDGRFLAFLLGSNSIKNEIKSRIASATLGKLSLSNIKSLQILLPSIQEQEEIVRILDIIFEKEDESKELIDLLDKIDAMKKTILAKAFRGQLNTNNPVDEPAIELLRKIIIERNEAEEEKSGQKKLDFDEEISLEQSRMIIKKIAQGAKNEMKLAASVIAQANAQSQIISKAVEQCINIKQISAKMKIVEEAVNQAAKIKQIADQTGLSREILEYTKIAEEVQKETAKYLYAFDQVSKIASSVTKVTKQINKLQNDFQQALKFSKIFMNIEKLSSTLESKLYNLLLENNNQSSIDYIAEYFPRTSTLDLLEAIESMEKNELLIYNKETRVVKLSEF